MIGHIQIDQLMSQPTEYIQQFITMSHKDIREHNHTAAKQAYLNMQATQIYSWQASLVSQGKCCPWMVLRFNSSKRPVNPLPMQSGYGWLWHLIVHQHSAAKVTILAVTSVRDLDMQYCDMMSSETQKWPYVCDPLSRSLLSW